MAKNTSLQNVLEIVMATSGKSGSTNRTAMIKKGELRKIAPRFIPRIWKRSQAFKDEDGYILKF